MALCPAHDIAEFKLEYSGGVSFLLGLQGFKDVQEADPERAPACGLGAPGCASITWAGGAGDARTTLGMGPCSPQPSTLPFSD